MVGGLVPAFFIYMYHGSGADVFRSMRQYLNYVTCNDSSSRFQYRSALIVHALAISMKNAQNRGQAIGSIEAPCLLVCSCGNVWMHDKIYGAIGITLVGRSTGGPRHNDVRMIDCSYLCTLRGFP